MSPDRRHFVLALTAALAACNHPILGAPHFDPKVLDKGFPALAARARPGQFSVGVMDLKTTATWYSDIDKPFPLGGAAVLPIALCLLTQVDEHKVSLTEKITVRDADLSPPYSLIGQSWRASPANFAMNITVIDLLTLAVQYGDNTAADVLLARAGGPGAVSAWLHQGGVEAIRVDDYARERDVRMSGLPSFRPAWRTPATYNAALQAVPVTDRQKAMEAFLADPRDSASAQGVISLLFKLSHAELASKASCDLLLKLMTPTANARGAMGGAWPATAAWAHKTAEPRPDLGFTPVQNDMGLVTLKDGRRFAVAAMLSGSTASAAQRSQLFSDTAGLMLKAMGV